MPTPPPPPPPNKPAPPYPIPSLSIRVDDLAHPGASIFFDAVSPGPVFRDAVLASFTWLYTPNNHPTHVQAILLVLRPMDGAAYTTGSHTHKEIHFSLDHIAGSASRAEDEICGVLTHEVVHCFQGDAGGTCPGGLIEGVADWVRLRAGLVPPHWNPTPGEKWDAGYQATAYFLDWLETRYGAGTVRELNGVLRRTKKYDEGVFKDLTGRKIAKLWRIYCEERGGERGDTTKGRDIWENSVVYRQDLEK